MVPGLMIVFSVIRNVQMLFRAVMALREEAVYPVQRVPQVLRVLWPVVFTLPEVLAVLVPMASKAAAAAAAAVEADANNLALMTAEVAAAAAAALAMEVSEESVVLAEDLLMRYFFIVMG